MILDSISTRANELLSFPRSGNEAQSVTVKSTGCGFDFFALVPKQEVALSSATQRNASRTRWKVSKQCLSTRFPLPTLLWMGYSECAGYSVKVKKKKITRYSMSWKLHGKCLDNPYCLLPTSHCDSVNIDSNIIIYFFVLRLLGILKVIHTFMHFYTRMYTQHVLVYIVVTK